MRIGRAGRTPVTGPFREKYTPDGGNSAAGSVRRLAPPPPGAPSLAAPAARLARLGAGSRAGLRPARSPGSGVGAARLAWERVRRLRRLRWERPSGVFPSGASAASERAPRGAAAGREPAPRGGAAGAEPAPSGGGREAAERAPTLQARGTQEP